MFKDILKKMVGDVPGAVGAIFADWEGESVEHYYAGPEDDIKLLGAHQGILLNSIGNLTGGNGTGALRCMLVSTDAAKLVVRPLKEGYYMVLMLSPGSNGGLALRASETAARKLLAEI